MTFGDIAGKSRPKAKTEADERFKETAGEVGADESSEVFERALEKLFLQTTKTFGNEPLLLWSQGVRILRRFDQFIGL
jgi:hypothetical protein